MARAIRPADRKLEPQHIKLLVILEAAGGEPLHQDDDIAPKMKPDPHMYAIEQMLEYGLIENPDPTMKREWVLTRRGEQTLILERKRLEAEKKAKPAAAPKTPQAKTKTTSVPAPKEPAPS